MKRRSGTKEWSDHSRNIDVGCRHGCLYCYAQYNAIDRYGHVINRTEWLKPRRHSSEHEKPKLLNGRIMFPTTHDICPENVDRCISFLDGWLSAGNEVLIVSKPHYDTVAKMCDWLKPYKKQITFRFTIGSKSSEHLKFWEPNAPGYEERKRALIHAYSEKFHTSVSCEPYYDMSIHYVVTELMPWVRDTIWIGVMNSVEARVKRSNYPDIEDRKWDYMMECLKEVSNPIYVNNLYNKFHGYPKVKWKESIKDMLGLPADEQVG